MPSTASPPVPLLPARFPYLFCARIRHAVHNLLVSLLAAGILLTLAVLLAQLVAFLESHTHPLRAWRLRRGPKELCPRCSAAIPLGTLSTNRSAYEQTHAVLLARPWAYWPTFDSSPDHHFQVRGIVGFNLYRRGAACGLCDTSRYNDAPKRQPASVV